MKKLIADRNQVGRLIAECAKRVAGLTGAEKVVFLGIQTRGVILAQRLIEQLKKLKKGKFPLGTLDITLYRDDFTQLGKHPVVKETRIDFDIEDKTVILVDDVLYTGRTIRAALDEIIDFGRPSRIMLLVLVDRGGRELPIQPDIFGELVEAGDNTDIRLMLSETDGEDAIYIVEEEGR
ncbi:MAG: bifunctional pyr operon transcriptional regulator/uracil phosphoribosyltransferase PyrR [Candidatus Wallbacteria bacterium]|nr:bifunctional pyr operon transcriptional regulator/uracil phosphoribosyltransferase PyrR [Candidatus Wallbacteria bacterium]